MEPGDLPAIEPINEAAFGGILEELFRVRPPRVFSPDLFADRLARDPAGCFVAEVAGRVVGSLFSVHWGRLAFFGPVAVDPAIQNRSLGQALVRACLDYWREIGVTSGGLETFPISTLHIHVYAKLGFAPLGLALGLEKPVAGALPPNPAIVRWSDLDESERAPALQAVDRIGGEFLAGFTPSAEAAAPAGEGETLLLRRDGDIIGFAVGQRAPHIRPGRSALDVPLAAVDPRRGTPDDLIALLAGAEALAQEAGRQAVSTRVYGPYFTAYQTLAAAGYRLTGTSVRMKWGPEASYDRPDLLLLDNWL